MEYLKTPLDRAQLESIVDSIDVEPTELVRKDQNFKALGLDPAGYTTRSAVVALLLENPSLMQRPIAVSNSYTILARPKERILDLL